MGEEYEVRIQEASRNTEDEYFYAGPVVGCNESRADLYLQKNSFCGSVGLGKPRNVTYNIGPTDEKYNGKTVYIVYMLTHKNILNNGLSIGDRQKFTYVDRLCFPVPLFHCFGIVLGVMAVLTHRATLVMLEIFDPLLVLAAVHKEKCTALYGVPTMFIAEYTHPMLSRLRFRK